MNKTQEQLEKLREVAEASLTKTEELHKVLAQIEALMSRDEMQKASKKITNNNTIIKTNKNIHRKIIKNT